MNNQPPSTYSQLRSTQKILRQQRGVEPTNLRSHGAAREEEEPRAKSDEEGWEWEESQRAKESRDSTREISAGGSRGA